MRDLGGIVTALLYDAEPIAIPSNHRILEKVHLLLVRVCCSLPHAHSPWLVRDGSAARALLSKLT